jgi:uncharacterized membrane protein YfcA
MGVGHMDVDFIIQIAVVTASMLLALTSFMTSRRHRKSHASYARAGGGLIVVGVVSQLVAIAFEEGIEDAQLPPAVLLLATLLLCGAVMWRRWSSRRARGASREAPPASRSNAADGVHPKRQRLASSHRSIAHEPRHDA